MDLKQKIELIQSSSSKEILNGANHNGTPLLKYVLESFEQYTGYACMHCSSNFPGYIKKIQSINLNTTEIMSKSEREYRMKSGSVIHIKGTNKYYSDLNITDEVAIEILKKNPNRKVLFSKMPKGAAKTPSETEENALSKVSSETKKEDTELSLTELREKYPDIKARSKDDFLTELKTPSETEEN